MYQGQAVDQNGHIVAVIVTGALVFADFVLVDDLQAVVVDVLFVDEGDILGSAVIPAKHLDKILLNFPGLFQNVVIGIGNGVRKEPLPLAVGKLVVVQRLQVAAQVDNQVGLLVDVQIVIPLLGQLPDEFLLQRRFALVAVRAVFHRLIGGDNGVFGCGGDNVIIAHLYHLNCKIGL